MLKRKLDKPLFINKEDLKKSAVYYFPGEFGKNLYNTGVNIAKETVKMPFRVGASIADMPLGINRGIRQLAGKETGNEPRIRSFNVPWAGKVETYQNSAENLTPKVIEGKEPLWKAGVPFVQVPLEVSATAQMAKGGYSVLKNISKKTNKVALPKIKPKTEELPKELSSAERLIAGVKGRMAKITEVPFQEEQTSHMFSDVAGQVEHNGNVELGNKIAELGKSTNIKNQTFESAANEIIKKTGGEKVVRDALENYYVSNILPLENPRQMGGNLFPYGKGAVNQLTKEEVKKFVGIALDSNLPVRDVLIMAWKSANNIPF